MGVVWEAEVDRAAEEVVDRVRVEDREAAVDVWEALAWAPRENAFVLNVVIRHRTNGATLATGRSVPSAVR